jgi:hypothetical protein
VARERALSGLLRYALRPEFRQETQDALEVYWPGEFDDVPIEEAIHQMEPENVQIAFLEWLVHDYRLEDDRTFLDHFLERRGYTLDPRAREVMERSRDTHLGLYQVLESRPGEGLTLRDLLEDAACEVVERTASQTLVEWDLIATRLMRMDGAWVILGGILPYPPDSKEAILKFLRGLGDLHREEEPERTWAEILKRSGFFFSHIYLDMHSAPPPQPVTPKGDPVLLSRAEYRMADRARVVEALRGIPELEETEEGKEFAWLEHQEGDRYRSLGGIAVKRVKMTLDCLSPRRLERCKALLEAPLSGLVTLEKESIRDPMEEIAAGRVPKREREPALPPEVKERLTRELLEEHYRSWPDEPLPALDGRTAREAVRTPEGRRRVADLLRGMENTAARAERSGQVGYAPAWLWEELGLDRDEGLGG